jgi:hypothetical protein
MSAVGTRRAGLCGATVLILLAACARIPDEGPVVDGSAPQVGPSAAPFDFSPPGPQRGATPEQVVTGFLTAMQASPLSTEVAREFLTDRAEETWQPESRTVLCAEYDVTAAPVVSGRSPVTVSVPMRDVSALDGTGRWLGRQPAVERSGMQMQVVREQGEWRVVDPPDALVLPLSHFENRYRRFALHFADPTGSVLVPEPVYLPMERQTATRLVEGLLAGPRGGARGVDRSFLPSRTQLVVSVPVDDDGVARVPLTGEVLDLDRRELTLAVAQLVWTLRQVPEVVAVRLTADGEPVTVPGIGDEVPADALEPYSPLVATASTDLYGLRDRSVRRVGNQGERTLLQLPPGVAAADLSVSLLGNPVAVTDRAGRVRVLARGSAQGDAVEPLTTVAASRGTRVRWDWSRALWLIPPRFDGEVQVLMGGRIRTLSWPASSLRGLRVDAATLSRDGSRLVLALSGDRGGSWLVLARVQRTAEGSSPPVALQPEGRVATGSPLSGVVDLGWRDAQTLAVLERAGRLRSRVLAVPVDGQAASGALEEHSDLLFGRAVAMAASPVGGQVRVTTDDGRVHALTDQGRWQQVDDRSPLRLPTFVG